MDTDLKLSDSKFVRYFKSYVMLQGKHVGFYGNFGHGDLGDDASFFVARELLGSDLLPVSKRSYAFNPRILKALLIGGGGNLRWESPYIPRKLLTQEHWDFPIVLFSAGVNCDFNKEYSKDSIDQIKELCKRCEYITVRDRISLNFLHDLGITDAALLPDLELLLKEIPREFDFVKSKKTIGIVVSPHSEFDSALVNSIAGTFVEFINFLGEKDYDTILIPFDSQISENTREWKLIEMIKNGIKDDTHFNVLPRNVSPGETLYAIRQYCDAMVCMRLHSAIFATNAGVPFISLSFNLMHKGFMELLDLNECELNLYENFSFDSLKEKFLHLMNQQDSVIDQLAAKKSELTALITKEVKTIQEKILIA